MIKAKQDQNNCFTLVFCVADLMAKLKLEPDLFNDFKCSRQQIFHCRQQNCRLPAYFDWAELDKQVKLF